MTPEERNERLEEMAVAMTALLAVTAPGLMQESAEYVSPEIAIGFALLLRSDVSAVLGGPEHFRDVFLRLYARMTAHAAKHKDA